jgi:hypothetical protein
MTLDGKPSNTSKAAPGERVTSKSGTHPAASLSNIKVRKNWGPGQTWHNLTKGEVEKYKCAHAEPQAKKDPAKPSLFKRLTRILKGRGNIAS